MKNSKSKEITFKIIFKKDIKDCDRKVFGDLLKKQNKVKGDFPKKADRCKLICIAFAKNKPIAIGGIKPKTISVFNSEKANCKEIENKIDSELGYIYTEPDYTGKGIAGYIVKTLISECGNEKLMASSEISNSGMVRILEKNGFKQHGKSWKSIINKKDLALFIKL